MVVKKTPGLVGLQQPSVRYEAWYLVVIWQKIDEQTHASTTFRDQSVFRKCRAMVFAIDTTPQDRTPKLQDRMHAYLCKRMQDKREAQEY